MEGGPSQNSHRVVHGTVEKNPPAKAGDKRCGFNPWMGKVAWRRPWQPAPVFVPGESHGQRSLGGCRPWGSSQTQLSRYTRTGSGPGVTQTCRAAQQLHGAGCRCALAHLTASCVPSDVPKNATDGQVAKHAGPGKTMTFIYLSLRKTGGANKRWT